MNVGLVVGGQGAEAASHRLLLRVCINIDPDFKMLMIIVGTLQMVNHGNLQRSDYRRTATAQSFHTQACSVLPSSSGTDLKREEYGRGNTYIYSSKHELT